MMMSWALTQMVRTREASMINILKSRVSSSRDVLQKPAIIQALGEMHTRSHTHTHTCYLEKRLNHTKFRNILQHNYVPISINEAYRHGPSSPLMTCVPPRTPEMRQAHSPVYT